MYRAWHTAARPPRIDRGPRLQPQSRNHDASPTREVKALLSRWPPAGRKAPRTEGKLRFQALHCTGPGCMADPGRPPGRAPGRRRRPEGRAPCAGCGCWGVPIQMEGTEPYPQWHAHVGHAGPADPVQQSAREEALGLDRNVGQATDRDGTVYALPDTERPAAQCPRWEGDPGRRQGWGPRDRRPPANRGRRVNEQPTQRHRPRRHRRDQATRQARRTPADTAPTVVVEDLNTKAGTAAAKGTGKEPGRNLKRKAGRHRSLPARGGRGPERKPAPKDGEPVTVNPAPTSQTCSRYGPVRRTHRPSQTLFVCGLRVPGQRRPRWGVIWIPARIGALRWGLFRGAGQGLPHGQGTSPWGIPATREPDGVEVPSGLTAGGQRVIAPLAGVMVVAGPLLVQPKGLAEGGIQVDSQRSVAWSGQDLGGSPDPIGACGPNGNCAGRTQR